jgi:hypothetical protein
MKITAYTRSCVLEFFSMAATSVEISGMIFGDLQGKAPR